MALIKTNDLKSWAIRIENFMVGKFAINLGARNIIFDVNIPYTYIPDSDFA